MKSWIVLAATAALSAFPALAQEAKVGAITITAPWSRETAPSQSVGGGFVTIANGGKADDRLVAASSPVAAEVQLHTMSMDGGVMRMRQLTDGIAVPAGGTVQLKPGSLHLMFIGLKSPLKRGSNVPVTFRFAKAGNVTVQFPVLPISATEAATAGGHSHDHH